jgi:hypothetical protein
MVRISNKVLLSGGLATVIGIAGCSKYEDNPAISFSTKTQRLTGDWEVTKLSNLDGSNMIGNENEMDIEFDKDGDFDMKMLSTYTEYTYDYYGNITSSWITTDLDTYSGEWEFSSDKEDLELDFDDPDEYDWDIEITKLTNKELEGELTVVGLGKFDFEAEKE